MSDTRPLSQLRYDRLQEGIGAQRLITLHKHNQFSNGVADLALAAAPGAQIIGLESFKGIFVGRDIVGFTWYLGPVDRPAPIFFGDSLAEIERFLWDYLDRQESDEPQRPFLLGVEQGAVMALAAALAVPDLLSGVIAVDGALPIVQGWDPPLAPLDGLPVLLVGDLAEHSDAPVLRRDDLAARLIQWGAQAVWSEAGDPERTTFIADWLAAQTARGGYPAPASETETDRDVR